MFKEAMNFVAIAATYSLCCQVQAAQISTWDGGGDGYSWSDAENWNPNIVPDGNYTVTIDAGAGRVEVQLQQCRTVNQLDCYGEVELEAWGSEFAALTLTDANGLTNHGELSVSSAGHQMEIFGNVTNTAGAELDLGGVEIKGDLHNFAGGVVEAEMENDVYGDLQNQGELIIIHASDLLCDSNNATIILRHY